MLEQLKNVLKEKDWDQFVSSLVINSFEILSHLFMDQPQKLEEYIKNIQKLKDIRIITDINEDEYLKSRIKQLSSLELKTHFPKDDTLRFKKENDRFIPDKQGEYRLNCYGYYNYFYETITVLNRPGLEFTFIHEYEHTTQDGFKVPSVYFGSDDIEFILSEGDSMEVPLHALKDDENLLDDLLLGEISYPIELQIFLQLKQLLGETFIESWKSDVTNKDYIEEMRNKLKEDGLEDTLKEIIALLFFVKQYDKINETLLEGHVEVYKRDILEFERVLKTINQKEQAEKSLNEVNKKLSDLNRQNTPEEKERKTRQQIYMGNIHEYTRIWNQIKAYKNDPEGLKAFILSEDGEFDETKDYEALIKTIILEEEESLSSSKIEKEIEDELNQRITQAKKEQQIRSNMIDRYEKQIKEERQDMIKELFSLDIVKRVSKRFEQFRTFSRVQKIDAHHIMRLELDLLFSECLLKRIHKVNDPLTFLDQYIFSLASSTWAKPYHPLNQDDPFDIELEKKSETLKETKKEIIRLLYQQLGNEHIKKIYYALMLNETKLALTEEHEKKEINRKEIIWNI